MFHSNFDDFLMSLAQRKKRSLSEEPEDYYRDYNRYNTSYLVSLCQD